MHIEIREQGKKKKYYLAYSFREGKKINKIRRYLGINLQKKQLEKLKKRAEQIIEQQIQDYKIISDPLKQELTESELSAIKNIEAKIDIRVEHLSKKEWLQFTELFTYNTNAIEGSEINQKEVKEVLEDNKWPQNVEKWEISETYGVAEAIKYIRKTKEHISISLIKKLHFIVFKNSKSFAGKFRKKGEEVAIRDSLGNILHTGAPSNRVKGLLEELIEWYNNHKNKYPPILLSAVVHNQFETIHPFRDGNGRVGRLLLNNILLKYNFPPINIYFKNRREYYNVLQEYQKKKNLKSTLNLILKEYKNLKKDLGVYKK